MERHLAAFDCKVIIGESVVLLGANSGLLSSLSRNGRGLFCFNRFLHALSFSLLGSIPVMAFIARVPRTGKAIPQDRALESPGRT
jgi:hypothetical protein